MARPKLLRLAWVAILTVSAFALGAVLKPSFAPPQRRLPGAVPMPAVRMPAPPPPGAWPAAPAQPRR